MGNYSNNLSNLMSKETYIISKCSIIIGEIILKDFKKLRQSSNNNKTNNFIKQLIETIDRKVNIHLSMNNMLHSLEVIDLNNPQKILDKNKTYFFYKFDGAENFSRGINLFTMVTGVIDKGMLHCFNIYMPEDEKILWYQKEDSYIYINNNIALSSKRNSLMTSENKFNFLGIMGNNIPNSINQLNLPLNTNVLNLNCIFFELYYFLSHSLDYLVISNNNLSFILELIINDLEKNFPLYITKEKDYLLVSHKSF